MTLTAQLRSSPSWKALFQQRYGVEITELADFARKELKRKKESHESEDEDEDEDEQENQIDGIEEGGEENYILISLEDFEAMQDAQAIEGAEEQVMEEEEGEGEGEEQEQEEEDNTITEEGHQEEDDGMILVTRKRSHEALEMEETEEKRQKTEENGTGECQQADGAEVKEGTLSLSADILLLRAQRLMSKATRLSNRTHSRSTVPQTETERKQRAILLASIAAEEYEGQFALCSSFITLTPDGSSFFSISSISCVGCKQNSLLGVGRCFETACYPFFAREP